MKYIAYGSNLNELQMHHRCPTAKKIESGIIKDYELLFRGQDYNAYATIEPKKGAFVQVGIWEIQEVDEKNLDQYEGFPHLYQKKSLEVCLHDATTIEGMVYVMDDRFPINMPNSAYLCILQDGYKDFGLDEVNLARAYNHTYDIYEEVQGIDMKME